MEIIKGNIKKETNRWKLVSQGDLAHWIKEMGAYLYHQGIWKDNHFLLCKIQRAPKHAQV